jgi:hypothetical protein
LPATTADSDGNKRSRAEGFKSPQGIGGGMRHYYVSTDEERDVESLLPGECWFELAENFQIFNDKKRRITREEAKEMFASVFKRGGTIKDTLDRFFGEEDE